MKNIAIIGAGISGLATAKAFKERGFQIVVLEKSASLGGVWDSSKSYINLTTQTTKNEYAYSDFPMPAHFDEWPSGSQMNEYLNSYAKQFGVDRHIIYNIAVADMQYINGKWRLQTTHTKTGKTEHSIFDFVVVCTGTFNQPYIPAFEGAQMYKAAGGTILHSSQIQEKEILERKNVVVVGFAKSATDIATHAADISSSCTLLYRKAQWKVPRFFANCVNLKYLLFSRFSEAFFWPYRRSVFQKILHSIGKPMVWTQWRMIELLLKKQFRLKQCGLLPQHRIEDQISCSLGIAPLGFYEKVRSGKIKAVHSEIKNFTSEGIVLQSGATIQTDMVVMGTGFKQSLPFLSTAYQDLIRNNTGQYQLYRNILNPKLPQVGFVGFNSSLFSTLTSEVAANWLAEYVKGNIVLPAEQEINAELQIIEQWKKTKRPIAREFSGLCVAPFNFQHLDQLMTDMGLRTRASKNPVYEFFKPINPKDYNKLLQQFRSWDLRSVQRRSKIPLSPGTLPVPETI